MTYITLLVLASGRREAVDKWPGLPAFTEYVEIYVLQLYRAIISYKPLIRVFSHHLSSSLSHFPFYLCSSSSLPLSSLNPYSELFKIEPLFINDQFAWT